MRSDEYILSVDPGNERSAYALLDCDLKPIQFGIVDNYQLLDIIEKLVYEHTFEQTKNIYVAIEMIASYGMAVGKTVFDTCVWIGRFVQQIKMIGNIHIEFIYRKDEKMNLCRSMKANDSNIRQALIDRFGVVGTKKNPGWFYGFKKDIWAAFAVGVTYHDMYLTRNRKEGNSL